ncbi:hypothetical protein SADUNF_Sadunf19G0032000 [Salix dunnii]|uniref:Response regulatory domain-containing protein n=1 Tax=Salix dunnii TaxID=1413687 RepID=A0A835J3L7_9ROSI|nr:hypothetical protein SADUNF_Sadunf19G0032000 [Salix dunnii]
MVHRMLMTSFGLKVKEAKNRKEDVDLHINGAYFDLILMDMEMPIMNGPTSTHKDFIEASLNHCVSKPLTIAKISSSFLLQSNNK